MQKCDLHLGEYLGEGSDPGFDRIVKLCDAALAAPPRNCDSFNSGDPMKDAEDAYAAWQRYCDDPMIPPSCKVESSFKNWLFAPATAEEG